MKTSAAGTLIVPSWARPGWLEDELRALGALGPRVILTDALQPSPLLRIYSRIQLTDLDAPSAGGSYITVKLPRRYSEAA